jgi:hypothetical protein
MISGIMVMLFFLLLALSSVYITGQITKSRLVHSELVKELESLEINKSIQKNIGIFIEKSKEAHSSADLLMTQLLQESRLSFLLIAFAFMIGALRTLKMRKLELELQDRVTKLEKWVPSSELN